MFVKSLARRWSQGICAIFSILSIIAYTPSVGAQVSGFDSDAIQTLMEQQDLQPTDRTIDLPSQIDTVRNQRDTEGQADQTEPDMTGNQIVNGLGLSPLEADYGTRVLLSDQDGRYAQAVALQMSRVRTTENGASDSENGRRRVGQSTNTDGLLVQYGYDIFSRLVAPTELSIGRAPANYILGVGDEFVIAFHGATQSSIVTKVDREGYLVVPDLRPVVAAGRTFEEVEEELRRNTEAVLTGTEIFVSLGTVRTVSVYVLGEVGRPGVQRITSMGSVLEALSLAGGVQKTGSLRSIRVVREGQVRIIDLYDILLGVPGQHLDVRDGDQIIVPSIGPTFAVTGEVNRAGIYELAPGEKQVSLTAALDYAGGTLRPRGYAFSANRIGDDGRQLIQAVSVEGGELRTGDILNVMLLQDVIVGSIRVLGHVRVPGIVSTERAPTVADLIHDSSVLKSNPYLPFAVVETTDPATQSRIFQGVNLEHVLKGEDNYTFHDRDWLYVFGMDDMAFLSSPIVQEVVVSGKAPMSQSTADGASNQLEVEQGQAIANIQMRTALEDTNNCRGLERVARVISDTQSQRFANAIVSTGFETGDASRGPVSCPKIFNINDEVLPFVLEHVVALRGSVRRPGVYPIAGNTNLDSLIMIAGGLMQTADLTQIEYLEYRASPEQGVSEITRHTINLVNSPADEIRVSSGSGLRFNQVLSQQESGGVLLSGEFVRPGFYSIRRGENLSQVIERAGGTTAQAYPYGAVFTRESAKVAQRQGFERAARELNSALSMAALYENADTEGLAAVLSTARELETVEAAGRVVIEADPTVLRVRPGLDVALEPGDLLHMPKRPSSVTVVGDVLNPGTLQFIPGKSAKEYLREAGSYQQTADKGRVFIVFPNGVAEPVSFGMLGDGSAPIPPGTTIVVPKDLLPFNWRTFATDMTQILSQLAISAAALATITN